MKVYHADHALIIEMGPLQRIFAWCKRVSIPRENIGQVYWDKHYTGSPGIVRLNFMFGIHNVFLFSGFLRRQGQREFWYLKHQEGLLRSSYPNVLSVDTINGFALAHVRITLDEAAAKEIIEWSQTFTGANRAIFSS
jgi:hypothetical protein